MKEIAVVALWLVAAIAFIAYKRPKAYRDLYPILIAIIACAAAFFAGMHSVGDASNADMLFIPDDDSYFVLPLGETAVPLFGVLVACTVAVAGLLVLRLLLQVVEDNEE